MTPHPTPDRPDRPDDLGWLLQPGEHVLWTGRPLRGPRLQARALFPIIVGLPFLGIGIVLVFISPRLVEDPPDIIGAIIFVAVFGGFGGYLVIAPLIAAHVTARHVRYALTNRCAFVLRDWPVNRIEIYPILPASEVSLRKGRKADTLWFHTRTEDASDPTITPIGFEHIPDGPQVLALVQSIQTGVAA